MPDLVNGLLATRPLVERVGEVVDKPHSVADIPVPMDHPWRDDHQHRSTGADPFALDDAVRGRTWSHVPQDNFKIRGADETEAIGLADVLVRSPGDPWFRQRDIPHERGKPGGEFIRPEHFKQPPAGIPMAGQRFPEQVGDGSR